MHVSPRQFAVLAEALTLAGVDPRPWMRDAGLPLPDALEGAAWRPLADLDTMLRITREATGDAGFGPVVATSLVQARHGMVVQLTMHAPTLRATLDDICRCGRLLHVGTEFSYAVDGAHCVLRFDPLGTTADGRRSRAEQVMGGMLMLLRYNGVWDEQVQHVHFAYPRPEYAARSARVFGAVLRFAQPACEIAFNVALLDAPKPGRDAAAYAQAKASANAELAELGRAASVGHAVRQLIAASAGPLAGMADAAAALGIAERTLRRKLQAEDLSYAQLLEAHRRAAAQRLLMLGDLPLKQIAATLGYASISSFHRAFRQRTGLTPLQWQRQQPALADAGRGACAVPDNTEPVR